MVVQVNATVSVRDQFICCLDFPSQQNTTSI